MFQVLSLSNYKNRIPRKLILITYDEIYFKLYTLTSIVSKQSNKLPEHKS